MYNQVQSMQNALYNINCFQSACSWESSLCLCSLHSEDSILWLLNCSESRHSSGVETIENKFTPAPTHTFFKVLIVALVDQQLQIQYLLNRLIQTNLCSQSKSVTRRYSQLLPPQDSVSFQPNVEVIQSHTWTRPSCSRHQLGSSHHQYQQWFS